MRRDVWTYGHGSMLSLFLKKNGTAVLETNEAGEKEVFLNNLPVSKPLWVIMELKPVAATEVKFVDER